MTALTLARKVASAPALSGMTIAGLEVDHNRLPAQAAVLAQQRGVDEDRIRRPQGAVPGVDVAEHMEPRPGLEDRFQQLRAAFPALRAWAVVKDGKRRAVVMRMSKPSGIRAQCLLRSAGRDIPNAPP